MPNRSEGMSYKRKSSRNQPQLVTNGSNRAPRAQIRTTMPVNSQWKSRLSIIRYVRIKGESSEVGKAFSQRVIGNIKSLKIPGDIAAQSVDVIGTWPGIVQAFKGMGWVESWSRERCQIASATCDIEVWHRDRLHGLVLVCGSPTSNAAI